MNLYIANQKSDDKLNIIFIFNLKMSHPLQTEIKHLNKSAFSIISQRFRFHLKRVKSTKNGETDLINLERSKNIDDNDREILKLINMKDDYFRQLCIEALNKCKSYIFIFYILEKLSIATTEFSTFFSIVAFYINITFNEILIICFILFFLGIFNSIGDWSRLREKYSNLYRCFEHIANCTDDTRIERFKKYVAVFSGENLSIDFISVMTNTTTIFEEELEEQVKDDEESQKEKHGKKTQTETKYNEMRNKAAFV